MGVRTDKSTTGFELGSSTRPGEGGLEFAGVVGVEATSPPSPSLSMAESSMNRYFLLLGSTTEMSMLESGERRKKRERRTHSCSCISQTKRTGRTETKGQVTRTRQVAKNM